MPAVSLTSSMLCCEILKAGLPCTGVQLFSPLVVLTGDNVTLPGTNIRGGSTTVPSAGYADFPPGVGFEPREEPIGRDINLPGRVLAAGFRSSGRARTHHSGGTSAGDRLLLRHGVRARRIRDCRNGRCIPDPRHSGTPLPRPGSHHTDPSRDVPRGSGEGRESDRASGPTSPLFTQPRGETFRKGVRATLRTWIRMLLERRDEP